MTWRILPICRWVRFYSFRNCQETNCPVSVDITKAPLTERGFVFSSLLLRFYFLQHLRGKFLHRQAALIPFPAVPHRYLAFFLLPCTHNEHVRDLLQLRFPDFLAQLFISAVHFNPDTCLEQGVCHLLGVGQIVFTYRNNLHLNRCEPSGEGPRRMLD